MLASSLKQKVRENQLTLGPMLTMDFWPGYLEIFKSEGMDFVLLDMEHSSASLRTAEELCRTARLLGLPLILRPESTIYHLLRKYLDMGPAGFMLPWIETQEQIQALQEAVFTPPKGRRGPGGPSIFANRSLDRQGWDEVESSLFIMTQYESPTGIRNLATLSSRDWIDATMLGPYDLSLNLGRCGQMDHPEVVAAIDRVRDESQKIGKPCGMVINSPEQAQFWIDRGFRFFICSEVSVMVRAQLQHLAGNMRKMAAEKPS